MTRDSREENEKLSDWVSVSDETAMSRYNNAYPERQEVMRKESCFQVFRRLTKIAVFKRLDNDLFNDDVNNKRHPNELSSRVKRHKRVMKDHLDFWRKQGNFLCTLKNVCGLHGDCKSTDQSSTTLYYICSMTLTVIQQRHAVDVLLLQKPKQCAINLLYQEGFSIQYSFELSWWWQRREALTVIPLDFQ